MDDLFHETAPAFLNIEAGMNIGETWIRLKFTDSTGEIETDLSS